MTGLVTRIRDRLTSVYLGFVDNLPGATQDFSWKVRWRMKNDRNPLFIVVQDKYRVKEYARERGVCTARTYYVTDDPQTIPFDSLPDNYFIKANHGCKWNIYCKDREFYYFGDGDDVIGRRKLADHKITREQVIGYCKVWLNRVYSRREWSYRNIVPKIIVEEVLEERCGGELINYRCYTFHGVVKAVYVDSATMSVNYQKIFVDTNWKEFTLVNPWEKIPHVLPEMPETFKEIIAAAERLGCEFDFMRVDLHDTTRGVMLGEMTVNPMGGIPMQPTSDRDFNQWLGDQWVLPAPRRQRLVSIT